MQTQRAGAWWWHTCDLKTDDNDENEQRHDFQEFIKEHVDIFFVGEFQDNIAAQSAMWFVCSMLFMHDIISLENHTQGMQGMRTSLLELIESVFQYYVFYRNGGSNAQAVYEATRKKIQMECSKIFSYHTNSHIGKAILIFCGCIPSDIENINPGAAQMYHPASAKTDFLEEIRRIAFVKFDNTETVVDSAISHQRVREMAWGKMVGCRLDIAHKNTIERQQSGESSIKFNPDKPEITMDMALQKNNYLNRVHTELRQIQTHLTEDIMYKCFMQNCAQINAPHHSNHDMYVIGGFEMWMPVLLHIVELKDIAPEASWTENLKPRFEPRIEIAIYLLTLAREFWYDCFQYDRMLRLNSDFNLNLYGDRQKNPHRTIARAEEDDIHSK